LKKLENVSSTLNFNSSTVNKLNTKVSTLELLKKNARAAWNVDDSYLKNSINTIQEMNIIEDPKFNIVTENYSRNPSEEIDEWD